MTESNEKLYFFLGNERVKDESQKLEVLYDEHEGIGLEIHISLIPQWKMHLGKVQDMQDDAYFNFTMTSCIFAYMLFKN